MKTRLFLASLFFAVSVMAEEAALSAPEAKRITLNGQTFELANSTNGENIATEEYVLSGEKLATWTQLVTVQRITLAKPSSPDEFATYFQKKISQENGARLDLLQQGRTACVFSTYFAKSDQNEEQMMVCLVFSEVKTPQVLNLIQYAIKPNQLAQSVVEMQLKAWKTQFSQQALSLVR